MRSRSLLAPALALAACLAVAGLGCEDDGGAPGWNNLDGAAGDGAAVTTVDGAPPDRAAGEAGGGDARADAGAADGAAGG